MTESTPRTLSFSSAPGRLPRNPETIVDFSLTADHLSMQARARKLADESLRPHASDVDINERYPEEGLRALAESGLCGLTVPKKYGGLAADAMTSCVVIEELARGCPSTAALMLTYGGTVLSVVAFGSEEQKSKYLPGVARGTLALSFALTELHCGSDAGAITASATRAGDHWVMNGRKAWIGNLGRADLTVVALKTNPAAGSKGVSSFLIEKGTPGFSVGEIYSKMGARGTIHGELVFEDARVPHAQLLGEVNRGFQQMMHSLDFVRLITASHAIGIAQAAYEEAVEYAKQRRSFGQALHKHQAIAFMIADMATDLHAARMITRHAAAQLDAGRKIPTEAAMAKLYASEAATRITHKAMQVFGAWGVKKGSLVEQMYREARITEIWDGTSEIQRLVISRNIFGRS
jgi:alkylation response protein AidB-like acyl-CoA dehydrogenase